MLEPPKPPPWLCHWSILEEEEEELEGPENEQDDSCLQSLYVRVRVREPHLLEKIVIFTLLPPFGEHRTNSHLSSYLPLPPPTDC